MPRILLIEDDADLRSSLERTLRGSGYEVVSSPDGAEGLKQYRAAPADLVITDLYMPNQDGVEIMMKLRKEFPQAKIIAMSGWPTAGALLAVAEYLGAVAILQKPFPPAQLLMAVENAL